MDSSGDNRSGKWNAPECPFTIEYAIAVLDDIRLAVVDAFFSMPRGGVEIGGILLGEHKNGRVSILNAVPLECEHALGPSFTLSGGDEAKLEEQLAALRENGNSRPVGWYHSHTRSGIFLSEGDLEIYRRFFPELWQVALVLKPHNLEPVRAGFFFRDTSGDIHASASHHEFLLEALPVSPVPGAQAARSAAAPRRTPIIERGPVLDTTVVESTLVGPAPEPLAEKPAAGRPEVAEAPVTAASPHFDSGATQTSPRWPAMVVTVLGLALGAGGYAAYQKRDKWWPGVANSRREPAVLAGKLRVELSAIDSAGQLQIRWDRDAPAIRSGADALLTITDGDRGTQTIRLDAAHLQGGTFTYGRQTGHVDVALTIRRPDAAEIREVTSFLGAPPPGPSQAETPETSRQRDALAEEAAKLKTDLNKQAERTRQLEKTVIEMRLEMLRRRMAAQIPDGEKK